MTAPQGDGDCAEVATKIVVDSRDKAYVLCHGYPTGQGPIAGVKHFHAWVEDGDIVIDRSNGKDITFPRDLYYAIGHINPDEVVRWTRDAAIDLILGTMHYGPWNEDEVNAWVRSPSVP